MEFQIDGVNAKTKKAFREAVATGGYVGVRNVSDMFEPPYRGDIRLAPPGRHIAVGPSATTRKWYASVDIRRDGSIVVK